MAPQGLVPLLSCRCRKEREPNATHGGEGGSAVEPRPIVVVRALPLLFAEGETRGERDARADGSWRSPPSGPSSEEAAVARACWGERCYCCRGGCHYRRNANARKEENKAVSLPLIGSYCC
ncbi:uncharacterized protein DS421_19g649760 [Arachis hypogaea]|uniref:Uncharacterized protein n=1 Tax=Arachis hypogaea TaxID=3818 RepID=A0A6B9V7V5_ARAHY|nr:uncharacterized protein DS421_19g649760 [Arachis hypogaea]